MSALLNRRFREEKKGTVLVYKEHNHFRMLQSDLSDIMCVDS